MMNEVNTSGLTHFLEGVLLIIVGLTTEILAPIFHMATANPGVGGFQKFLIIYGICKLIGGLYLLVEWSR
jgi:hypothetical protein